jgi:ribosomal protein S6
MRNYELFLLLGSKGDEASAQKSLREIETVLNKYGGKFVKVNNGSNTKLKYPIKDRNEAYQVTVDIEAETQDVVEIRKQLSLLEDILRLDIFSLANS